ncbi:MAG: hypothetical protein RDU01_11770 [Thermodesulfovibrionales bacterium]|nr:hypothetical protein [Thermodesulfovibrionales bacterium]
MPKKSKHTPSLSEEKRPAGVKKGGFLPHPFTDILQSNVITWIASFVLLFSVLCYYASIDYDYDIWFHLKYGELYLKNHTWDIDHTAFSWTPVDPGWKYVTWIGSALLYMVYQAANIPGLYVLMWLIFFIVSGLFVFYVKSTGSGFDIRHVTGLMLIAAAMGPTAVIIKPELFTILFFAFAVFAYFYARSGLQNFFLVYPVLFLIWANTHGGFIFGLFFISLILCGELFNYFLLKKDALQESSLKRLTVAVVLSYLATLINPHGITYHSALLQYLSADTYIGVTRQFYAYSDLWQLLFANVRAYRPMVSAWSMLGMLTLFLVALVHIYRKKRECNLTLLVTNLAFFFIGMNMARASIFFPLLWIFSIVSILKRPDSVETRKISLSAALLVLVCLSGIFFNYYAAYSSRSWLGSHMEEFIPEKETKFIQENSLPGPVLNDYLTGGYMIWSMYPEYKVFIDPRYGPYVNTVLPDWLRIKTDLSPEGLQKFTSRYPFRIALIGLEEIDIICWLLKSPEWKLAYFDKAAVVIVHRTVFQSINPDSLKLNLGPERFRNISNPRILLQLFNLYLNLRTEYAREILDIYRSNVSSLYKFRGESIYRMEQSLSAMEFRLKQIRPQNQP